MSIIDPLGKRANSTKYRTTPLPLALGTHLRGPENCDTPRSRDIFNVARRLEAGQPVITPPKPSLTQRFLRLVGLGTEKEEPKPVIHAMTIEDFQGQRQAREYQRMLNTYQRLLPEEHVAAHKTAREEHKEAVKRKKLSNRKFNGPVPRRPKLPETKQLSNKLDTAFLTPIQKKIYNIMHNAGRCATLTPFTSSQSEDRRQKIMLVHPTNVVALKQVQQMVLLLTPQDQTSLVCSLEGLLNPYLMPTLKILVFQPDVHVTSTSNSGKGYSPERKALRKPASWELFSGKINASWEQITPQPVVVETRQDKKDKKKRKNQKGGLLYDQTNEEGQEYKHKPSVFQSFEQKPFMPELTLGSDDEEDDMKKKRRRVHLRGGGGEEGHPLPFERSVRAYLVRGDCLTDEERVPRTLFWLAGGRVSPRKKAPTAGEMRSRRKAEVKNRKKVGFVGTLFGVRRPTAAKREATDDGESKEPEESLAAAE